MQVLSTNIHLRNDFHLMHRRWCDELTSSVLRYLKFRKGEEVQISDLVGEGVGFFYTHKELTHYQGLCYEFLSFQYNFSLLVGIPVFLRWIDFLTKLLASDSWWESRSCEQKKRPSTIRYVLVADETYGSDKPDIVIIELMC